MTELTREASARRRVSGYLLARAVAVRAKIFTTEITKFTEAKSVSVSLRSLCGEILLALPACFLVLDFTL